MSGWTVAAAWIVDEETKAGVTAFDADITSMCVVSGLVEFLTSFLRACLSAAAVISLSSPVFKCCYALPRPRVAPATGQDSTTLPHRSCEGRHVLSRGQPVQ